MANSAGGQLVYGIEEDKATKKPKRIDDGVADPKVTREWIEQVLNSRVQPRMSGVTTNRVDLENGNFAYVVNVPQTQTGPHQAPDGKYYKRFDLQSVSMHDYEIRNIMRRATTPNLEVELSFGEGKKTSISEFRAGQPFSKSFLLECTVINRSATPAFHTIVEVYVDNDLGISLSNANFVQVRVEKNKTGQTFKVYRRTINAPLMTPIFQEAVHQDHSDRIGLLLPETFRHSSYVYFETSVQCPGLSKREEWFIDCRDGHMRLQRAPPT